MASWQKFLLFVIGLLLLGTIAPPVQAANTVGSLRADRTTILPGQTVDFTGRIPPWRTHRVIVQFSIYGSAFNDLKTISTDSRGRFSFSTKPLLGHGWFRYRVKSPGSQVYVTPVVRIDVANRPIHGVVDRIFQGALEHNVAVGGFQGNGQSALVNDQDPINDTTQYCVASVSTTAICASGPTASMSDNVRFVAVSSGHAITVHDRTEGTSRDVDLPDEVASIDTGLHTELRVLNQGGVVFTADNDGNTGGTDVYRWTPGAVAARLTNGPVSGAWSRLRDATPAGSKVLVQTGPTDAIAKHRLRLIDPIAGSSTTLVRLKSPGIDLQAKVSNSGRRVVFNTGDSTLREKYSCRPGGYAMYTWTADGGVRRVGPCVDVADLDVSGDGSRIAFTSTDERLAGGDNDLAMDLFVLDRQTGKILRLTQSTRTDEKDGMLGDVWLNATGSSAAFMRGRFTGPTYGPRAAIYLWHVS